MKNSITLSYTAVTAIRKAKLAVALSNGWKYIGREDDYDVVSKVVDHETEAERCYEVYCHKYDIPSPINWNAVDQTPDRISIQARVYAKPEIPTLSLDGQYVYSGDYVAEEISTTIPIAYVLEDSSAVALKLTLGNPDYKDVQLRYKRIK